MKTDVYLNILLMTLEIDDKELIKGNLRINGGSAVWGVDVYEFEGEKSKRIQISKNSLTIVKIVYYSNGK